MPTIKLAQRGSWRAKIRKGEPIIAADSLPVCPAYIQGEARLIWERTTPELVRSGIMKFLDSAAFARYCIYTVLWLKELGSDSRRETSLEQYSNQLHKLESSFGLTPSARVGLIVNAGKNDSGKDTDFFQVG